MQASISSLQLACTKLLRTADLSIAPTAYYGRVSPVLKQLRCSRMGTRPSLHAGLIGCVGMPGLPVVPGVPCPVPFFRDGPFASFQACTGLGNVSACAVNEVYQ